MIEPEYCLSQLPYVRIQQIACQQSGDANWLDLSSIDAELRATIAAWNQLTVENRNAVAAIVASADGLPDSNRI